MSNIKGNVLILASYCGEDDRCSDLNPCVDCLLMCNAALAEIKEVYGQPEFEVDLHSKNQKLDEQIKKLTRRNKKIEQQTAKLKADLKTANEGLTVAYQHGFEKGKSAIPEVDESFIENMVEAELDRDEYKKALEEIQDIAFRMVGNVWEEDSSKIEDIAKNALNKVRVGG